MTADPIAVAYSAAASAANGGTMAARPGGSDTVFGADVAPVSDDELTARLAALHDAQSAVLAALSTLRDSDAAGRAGLTDRLAAATTAAWRTSRELQMIRYPAVPGYDED